MSFVRRNLRTVLVYTLTLLVVVSGSLSITPPPSVQACNGCSFLLKWGSVGTSTGKFRNPFGVAVDSGANVYVVDNTNNRIEKFTSTGTYVTAWGCPTAATSCSSSTAPGEFNDPKGVAVDSSGNVYVTDYGNNRVEKFTSSGTFLTSWNGTVSNSIAGPQADAVDSSGNVYVVDYAQNRVEKFTGTGTYVSQLGCPTGVCTSGSSPGKFNLPVAVAVDSSGNVYVSDDSNNRVEKFNNTGGYVTAWGCPTAGTGCSSGSGPGNFSGALGVAVDSGSNVYVADYSNNRVEQFTGTGGYITAWGCPTAGTGCSASSGDGNFNGPIGVAVDSLGNVYVTEYSSNDRVQLFGDFTVGTIGLVVGWNLISLPIIPVNPAIGKVLNDLIVSHSFTIVWSYQAGAWKSFTPPSLGTLTTMQDGFGYWIYVTYPFTWNLLGYVIHPGSTSPPSYSLSVGWNLVGFKPQPTLTSETVGAYLTSISGHYNTNSVWIYDSSTGTWIRASGSTPIPVGEALWVDMTTPATLRP